MKRNRIAGGERLALIRQAAKLYGDFSGHESEIVGRVRAPKIPPVLVKVGQIDFIGYRTVRDGRKEKYIHKFAKGAKPMFCVSADGKQIFLLGGNYSFTEQGIVDKT